MNKRENESELQYIWRLCSEKDAGTIDLTWEELTDILNKELRDDDEYWTSSAYRKKYQQAKAFYEEVFSKMEKAEYHDSLMDQKRELERMKIQYRDERNAWNKQNYANARAEQKLDYLESVLKDNGRREYVIANDVVSRTGENDLLILLSDIHIGQTFGSAWGRYNTEIAADRLGQYLNRIMEIADMHQSKDAYVNILGDLISNSIHKSLQVTNRENVIDQIKIAADLIGDFIFRLSQNFDNVTVSNVSGNHSRMESKEDAMHDERLDDLIGWIVQNKLSHVKNVKFEQNIDIGISYMTIRNKSYVGVHGDYDNFSKDGIANLSMLLGFIPYCITLGHLHCSAFSDINGVKLVRGGSLAGSGDSYTIEKRLRGEPSQTVLVCGDDGIIAHYPITLK